MMGGHAIDAAYWFDRGRFVTFAGRAAGLSVGPVNLALDKAIAAGAAAFGPPAWCSARQGQVAAGRAGVVGQGRFVLSPGQADAFRASPRMDAATLDLAARLLDDLKLGHGPAPDLLSISLSATDYVGHAYGHQGMEMCIQLAELDRALGRFLVRLDAAGVDYQVVLTADHGGLDLPERLTQQALPAATRADPALTPASLGRALAMELGLRLDGPLIYGDAPFGDWYLSHALDPTERARVLAAVLTRLRASPQVAAAFSAAELAALPMPAGNPQDWTLAQRARAGFDPERSGDLMVLLARDVVPILSPGPGYVATHGSAWDYDRRVPLLFWRKGPPGYRQPGFEQPSPVDTVDIAPTLAAILHLAVPPGSFDGRCLDTDGSAKDTCAFVARPRAN